jgi:amidase
LTDIAFFPAFKLAGMLRSREIGCAELLEHYLRRVERFNPALNAIIWMDVEAARTRAGQADAALARGENWGPLHGLPMTIKESFELLGSPTTWGIPAMRQNMSRGNAVAVQRLINAGAVIFGKTNVPLLLADWQSFNEIYGTTNNPWDLTKTPGGSSGGSSAALAAGLSALELGSDIGASIRNPAHYCGVMGHKPTWGIVPPRGQTVTGAMAMTDISVSGPLARSVDDLALALGTLAGPDELDEPGWRLILPKPKKTKLADFRVAVMTDHPNCAVDSEYAQRIADLGQTLAKAGAKVSFEARPSIDLAAAHRIYIRLLRGVTMSRVAPEAFAEWQRKAAALSPEDQSYKAQVARAATILHRDWLAAHEERTKLRWAWREFFKEWDVLLTPAAAGPAWPHDQKGDRLDRKIMVNGRPEDTNDQLFWAGISGVVLLPSTITPLGLNKDGLPLGVQIIGDHLQDLTAIEMARLIVEQIGGFVPPPEY